MPPLSLSREEVDEAMGYLRAALDEAIAGAKG
jgi:adenosylmethionine-8-amino-7-oxononanoate aminotransferase